MASCSNDNQQQLQNILREEFIKTYIYVTQNYSVSKNMSNSFDYMANVNSEAFNTIAYQWHRLASNICRTSETQINLSQQSGYEKLLAGKSEQQQTINKISDEDRKCLADVYKSHWMEINNMLIFNYPNSK